ncbi:hypothetical protein GPA10_18240 [Streptomyces sp. p1417]|uniref:Uncharacterized protein n=1 Tax=Streptomyces typhae TaxID=2681492 RepID=A0A6L6WYQ7_9ACTN|nr:hypothetical protein [Streptomyces typhae]MVO86644.1 hypothetical protein [Streptomyces typhae]
MPTARVTHCPACRKERITRYVGRATVKGQPQDLVQCPAGACELVWAVRPDHTPRRLTAA